MITTPSYVWILLGGALQVFAFGKWIVPIVAWLVPIFLLHFTRGAQPVSGVLLVWFTLFIALSVANRDVILLYWQASLGEYSAPNTALHLTAIPLCFISAGELGRYAYLISGVPSHG